MDIVYKHTQYGAVTIISLGLGAVVSGAVVFWTEDSAGLIITVGLALSILAFGSLTVQVSRETVRFWFGVGLIRKTFAVSDIESARVVRNSWLYGWGIRYTPHGWLYNVSGLGAVELQLRSGKKLRVGSDEPERLEEAVRGVLNVEQ